MILVDKYDSATCRSETSCYILRIFSIFINEGNKGRWSGMLSYLRIKHEWKGRKLTTLKGLPHEIIHFCCCDGRGKGTRYRNFVQNHPIMNIVYKQVD
jgi:hypothetical protein